MQNFYKIAHDEPVIWKRVAQIHNLNFERALRMTDALMVRTSEARVAAILLQLGRYIFDNIDVPRDLDITQNQVAAIANISRSALTPILKSFEAIGYIKLAQSKIYIADPTTLRSISH